MDKVVVGTVVVGGLGSYSLVHLRSRWFSWQPQIWSSIRLYYSEDKGQWDWFPFERGSSWGCQASHRCS